MSSSEEYLDSLLDSILSGDQASEGSNDKDAQGAAGETKTNADAGKAMSTAEIEEMLVSMGTLGNEEETATDMSPDDQPLEDMSLDDLSLDDLSLEEGAVEETGDSGEEDLSMNDMSLDDVSLDDLSLDDLSLDDLSLEESAAEAADDSGEVSLDDMSSDDFNLDDLALEESGEESAGEDEPEGGMEIEELDLDGDDGIEDLALEEHMMDEMEASDEETVADDADGLMSEEDIDRLLSGEDSGDSSGDFALEESEEGAEGTDELSDLLAGMDHDEELAEINDLLEASDQGVSADDDMLAMLEETDQNGDSFDFFENDEAAKEAGSIRELSPEEIAEREGEGKKAKKEKKKRKKLFGKKKKKGEEETESEESAGTELEDLLGTGTEETETPAEEKKPGVFARIMNFLLESDEDDEDPLSAEILADNGGETGTVTDENKELLAELSEEDKKGKKKKKKDKKGKKGKGGEAAEGEEGAEDNKKKKKKEKKEKKKKEEDVDLLAPPEKKLSKKKVMTVFVFCGTLAACIVLITTFLPNYMQKREAHAAYDHGKYDEVFMLLYDKERNEQDEILFQRSNLVLQMERKLDSYDNYIKMNMRLEALNALISGVSRYQRLLPEAEKYNVVGEVSDSYAQILERLSADFGVSEEQALEIIASEDDVTYSQKLEAIISGALYGEEIPTGRQDVLPEEEEIIERIEGLE